jgi:hypothetical protein
VAITATEFEVLNESAYKLGKIDGRAESAEQIAVLRLRVQSADAMATHWHEQAMEIARLNRRLAEERDGLMRMVMDVDPPPSWWARILDAVKRRLA